VTGVNIWLAILSVTLISILYTVLVSFHIAIYILYTVSTAFSLIEYDLICLY